MTQPIPSKAAYALDLVLYLGVMFGIRELYFDQLDFIANGLFWSLTTLLVATWRMRARGISWKDLGLTKPKLLKTLGITVLILIATVVGIMSFEILKDFLSFDLNPDTSSAQASVKFGLEKGGWTHFLMIIPLVWLQSALEEMLDRAAIQQERELETLIATFMGLFEPLLIVFMGLIVLMIVLSILMPIINMNELMQ